MTLYIGDKPVGLYKVVKDTKYIDKTKYGVSIDDLLGKVDENGVLQKPTGGATMDLTGVKTLSDNLFRYFFANSRVAVEHFYAPDLETNSYSNEFYYAFDNNAVTKTAVFGYKTLSGAVFNYAFRFSTQIMPRFTRLKKIAGGSTFRYAFDGRVIPNLDEIFPVLEEISGNYAMANLGYVPNDKVIRFSSLIKITGATSSTYTTFYGLSSPKFYLPKCTTLENKYIFPTSTTEIHFAAENQAAIEASENYATKWGATSSTIYFDL